MSFLASFFAFSPAKEAFPLPTHGRACWFFGGALAGDINKKILITRKNFILLGFFLLYVDYFVDKLSNMLKYNFLIFLVDKIYTFVVYLSTR